MWFRMGFNVLHSSLFADATTPTGSGDRVESRYLLLIQMLCATAEGCTFDSTEFLQRRFGANAKNARIVWDSCINNGAFTRLPNGKYTMYCWMDDNGLIGRVSSSKTLGLNQSRNVTVEHESDGDITQRLAKVSGHAG